MTQQTGGPVDDRCSSDYAVCPAKGSGTACAPALVARHCQAKDECPAANTATYTVQHQQWPPTQTGDPYWDAAQQQLVRTGELHNNVRMAWGKAPLLWTPSPELALSTVIYLNHKYALDGCDPASYGGILWCFGLFDVPKGPASASIFG